MAALVWQEGLGMRELREYAGQAQPLSAPYTHLALGLSSGGMWGSPGVWVRLSVTGHQGCLPLLSLLPRLTDPASHSVSLRSTTLELSRDSEGLPGKGARRPQGHLVSQVPGSPDADTKRGARN